MADDFDHFGRRSFGAVRASAAADPIASRVFLERLNGIRLGATSAKRRDILVEEDSALAEQAELELKGPALREVSETQGQLFSPLYWAGVSSVSPHTSIHRRLAWYVGRAPARPDTEGRWLHAGVM